MKQRPILIATASCLLLAACNAAGPTTAEVQSAAKERVRQTLGLTPEAALFSNVFVGEEVEGTPVLCGTVRGRTAEGRAITPRRFIAATDPARWVKFEPADGLDPPTAPNIFVNWHEVCAGEEAAT